ncbi:MAG TPA: glycosyltransferase family 4 protein, partial [Gemmatimonadaceae bacterium]|nr:glycosyltransferase family 4 protein [Gemmatimonadaceae bacterium]
MELRAPVLACSRSGGRRRWYHAPRACSAMRSPIRSQQASAGAAPKRILFVEPAGLLWGSERALLDLVRHLDRTAFEPVIACPPGAPLLERLRALRVPAVEVPLSRLHHRGAGARAWAAIALLGATLRVRPDLIHVNQAGLARLAVLAGRLLRIPVVCHVRMQREAEVLRVRRQEWLAPDARIAVSGDVAERMGAHAMDRTITDPFDAAAFVEGTGDRSAARRRVRQELMIAAEAPVMGLFARVCRDKRQDMLVAAAPELLRRYPEAHFLVVGAAPESDPAACSYEGRLRAGVRAERLEQRIHFTGQRDDIGPLMAACDAIVLPSVNETFGRVLLEGIALSVPIVVARAAGPAEIVGDDERGLSFPPDDLAAMIDTIDRTLSRPDEAAARASVAREWLRDRCAPPVHARAVERLYHAIL